MLQLHRAHLAFATLTLLFTLVMKKIPFAYAKLIFSKINLLHIIMIITLCNNVYQMITHLITTVKFMGYNVPQSIIPLGARDDQTAKQFTVYNYIDIMGWLTHMISMGYSNVVYNILTATHIAAAFISTANPVLFHRYYIRTENTPLYFQYMKAGFVFLDASSRTYSLYTLINKFIK